MRQMKTKYFLTLSITAFVLHILWENAQAVLYSGYESFFQHFPMCLYGTIGDVIITILVFPFIRLIKKDEPRTISDYLALAIMGFIIAIAIEQNALLMEKWNYAPSMPILPGLKVGLAGVAQMTILLPLSFYLAKVFSKKTCAK